MSTVGPRGKDGHPGAGYRQPGTLPDKVPVSGGGETWDSYRPHRPCNRPGLRRSRRVRLAHPVDRATVLADHLLERALAP